MREEGSNDVTIFSSLRYLYVGAGLVAGEMNVIELHYFLIFFQIVCRDLRSIHTLARQQLPLSGRPSKFFSPNRDIGIYEHCGIAHLERVTVFSDNVSIVEIWQYVRTIYGADILPTERQCMSLDKIIIITVINVVIVTDLSDREPRLRRLVFRRSGGYGFRIRLRPDFEISQCRGVGGGRFLFFATVSVRGYAGSGKTLCRKSAIT